MTPDQDRRLTRQAAWITEHPWLATGIICFWIPLAMAVVALGLKQVLSR